MAVYLLHFMDRVNPEHPARHYLGYARDVSARLQAHRSGRGARLCQVARERGVAWKLARVWEGGTRELERRLKNQHNAPRLCPLCRDEPEF